MVKEESYYINITKTHKLHLKRIYENPNGEPIFMLHGAIENGKIFYSKKQKGLAPFLARAGYDVYIGDLRGRNLSAPVINGTDTYGQTEAIIEDIPAFMDFIARKKPKQKQFWVAHSWGGVLMTAFFARFPERIDKVAGCCYFASKRSVKSFNLGVLFKVHFIWNWLAPLITFFKGYLPAKQLGFGSDNETRKSHRQSRKWVKTSKWIDSEDGFDYHKALKKITMPPILYFAAQGDKALGNPKDVQRFMNESGQHIHDYVLLCESAGHRHNYDHISIVTHPDAREEQFQILLNWIEKCRSGKNKT